jgi:DNA-binding response OmpR family regulator
LEAFFSEKYEVSTAYNGLDGIKEFDNSDGCVDLVITDLVMPEISGIGVITVIKKKSPKLPVIAMTGWGEHPGALARDAKADLVLNKPFELEDLDRHVAGLLARKS